MLWLMLGIEMASGYLRNQKIAGFQAGRALPVRKNQKRQRG